MISNASKRSILRWIHLIFTIPILGYFYSPFVELPNYAPVVRFVLVPVLILSGYWMFSGVFFAIIGVAVWSRCILSVWNWGGYPESGRAIHRAEDLVGDSCATFKVIGPIHAVQPTAARYAVADLYRYSVTFMVRLRKFNSMPPLFGLSSFL